MLPVIMTTALWLPDQPLPSHSRILPKLYQGSAPRSAVDLLNAGFETVVFCAREVQPPDHALLTLEALRCPLDDREGKIPSADWIRAVATAREVALRVRDQRRVLVTCAMGLNRSGLVTALAVHLLTGAPGVDCIQLIQHKRPGALGNQSFVRRLSQLRRRR